MNSIKFSNIAVTLLAAALCTWVPAFAESRALPPPSLKGTPQTQQEEADQMANRAAIAIVYKDWQTNANPNNGLFMRGYNIGSVLVDYKHNYVWWARNNVGCYNNGTQHGEVRAIQQYTFSRKQYYIDDGVIYTTLEPCSMCAGMMSMEKAARTVYAQHDPSFGDALQRLALNSTKLGPPPEGFIPYPRVTKPQPSTLEFYGKIATEYAAYCGTTPFSQCNIVAFLATPQANALYAQETRIFQSYNPLFPENGPMQKALLKLYQEAPVSNGQCKDPEPTSSAGSFRSVKPIKIE